MFSTQVLLTAKSDRDSEKRYSLYIFLCEAIFHVFAPLGFSNVRFQYLCRLGLVWSGHTLVQNTKKEVPSDLKPD